MSTQDVQKALADLPDFGRVTMRYDEGGKFEIWQMGTRSVRVKASATPDEIRQAFDRSE